MNKVLTQKKPRPLVYVKTIKTNITKLDGKKCFFFISIFSFGEGRRPRQGHGRHVVDTHT